MEIYSFETNVSGDREIWDSSLRL